MAYLLLESASLFDFHFVTFWVLDSGIFCAESVSDEMTILFADHKNIHTLQYLDYNSPISR